MFAAKLSFECIPLASSSTLLAQLQIIELVNSVQPYTLKEAGYLLLVSNPRFVFSSDWNKLTKTAQQQIKATFNPSNVKHRN